LQVGCGDLAAAQVRTIPAGESAYATLVWRKLIRPELAEDHIG
jgi:hypothetical protein